MEVETFRWLSHQCPQFSVSHPECMVFPSPFLLLVSVSMMPTPVAQTRDLGIVLPAFSFTTYPFGQSTNPP